MIVTARCLFRLARVLLCNVQALVSVSLHPRKGSCWRGIVSAYFLSLNHHLSENLTNFGGVNRVSVNSKAFQFIKYQRLTIFQLYHLVVFGYFSPGTGSKPRKRRDRAKVCREILQSMTPCCSNPSLHINESLINAI